MAHLSAQKISRIKKRLKKRGGLVLAVGTPAQKNYKKNCPSPKWVDNLDTWATGEWLLALFSRILVSYVVPWDMIVGTVTLP